MGTSIPAQHPAVVLRSQYRHLRALLAIAMVAVVALSVTVVLLADDDSSSVPSAASLVSAAGPAGEVRFDGGPEEGTRGIVAVQPPAVRFDGGPEEGTRGPLTATAASTSRFDGGPEEGSRGPGH
jgi:hypothetical protein